MAPLDFGVGAGAGVVSFLAEEDDGVVVLGFLYLAGEDDDAVVLGSLLLSGEDGEVVVVGYLACCL